MTSNYIRGMTSSNVKSIHFNCSSHLWPADGSVCDMTNGIWIGIRLLQTDCMVANFKWNSLWFLDCSEWQNSKRVLSTFLISTRFTIVKEFQIWYQLHEYTRIRAAHFKHYIQNNHCWLKSCSWDKKQTNKKNQAIKQKSIKWLIERDRHTS